MILSKIGTRDYFFKNNLKILFITTKKQISKQNREVDN